MQRPLHFYIVAASYLQPTTAKPKLGGTETYTAALSALSAKSGGTTTVFQRAGDFSDLKIAPNISVSSWKNVRRLREMVRMMRRKERGVLLLYENVFAPKEDELPCVLIHHGIGGDGTKDPATRSSLVTKLADVRRYYRVAIGSIEQRRLYSRFSRVVCVDTNVINQLRSAHPMYDWSALMVYVPNFASLLETNEVQRKWSAARQEKLVVLFARRFVTQRGIYLWADCVARLSKEFPNCEFRFVGYGEGEMRIRNLANAIPNVKVYARDHDQMLAEHAAAHIEVVPSLWSEGTSLSCIEAMAAGCALVCSDVGGLGNLILPGFNGEIVPPNQNAFYARVKRLIMNPGIAQRMGLRAYEVAAVSFSREAWEERIAEVALQAIDQSACAPVVRRRGEGALYQ